MITVGIAHFPHVRFVFFGNTKKKERRAQQALRAATLTASDMHIARITTRGM